MAVEYSRRGIKNGTEKHATKAAFEEEVVKLSPSPLKAVLS